jgi:hypothetical protein
MARKPSEPSPQSTGSKTADSAEVTNPTQVTNSTEATNPTEVTGSTEVTGPIGITRLRKADGRALILYSTAGERA